MHTSPNAAAPVDFLVVGAMKCGTTSLHHYLSCHPRLQLAREKEVNFFFGTEPAGPGNLWRGVGWYRQRFEPDGRLRGDISPGYTSPDHPHVAEEVAAVAPRAKLLYLVRDPLGRAVSQYRHHRRDRAEHRPLEEAVLDPSSHYVLRSRYADRIRPFLDRFPASQIAVVDHLDLRRRTAETVASVCRFLGVAPLDRPSVFDRRLNAAGTPPPPVPDEVVTRFEQLVGDDAAAFASLRQQLHACAPDADRPRPGAPQH